MKLSHEYGVQDAEHKLVAQITSASVANHIAATRGLDELGNPMRVVPRVEIHIHTRFKTPSFFPGGTRNRFGPSDRSRRPQSPSAPGTLIEVGIAIPFHLAFVAGRDERAMKDRRRANAHDSSSSCPRTPTATTGRSFLGQPLHEPVPLQPAGTMRSRSLAPALFSTPQSDASCPGARAGTRS